MDADDVSLNGDAVFQVAAIRFLGKHDPDIALIGTLCDAMQAAVARMSDDDDDPDAVVVAALCFTAMEWDDNPEFVTVVRLIIGGTLHSVRLALTNGFHVRVAPSDEKRAPSGILDLTQRPMFDYIHGLLKRNLQWALMWPLRNDNTPVATPKEAPSVPKATTTTIDPDVIDRILWSMHEALTKPRAYTVHIYRFLRLFCLKLLQQGVTGVKPADAVPQVLARLLHR